MFAVNSDIRLQLPDNNDLEEGDEKEFFNFSTPKWNGN